MDFIVAKLDGPFIRWWHTVGSIWAVWFLKYLVTYFRWFWRGGKCTISNWWLAIRWLVCRKSRNKLKWSLSWWFSTEENSADLLLLGLLCKIWKLFFCVYCLIISRFFFFPNCLTNIVGTGFCCEIKFGDSLLTRKKCWWRTGVRQLSFFFWIVLVN